MVWQRSKPKMEAANACNQSQNICSDDGHSTYNLLDTAKSVSAILYTPYQASETSLHKNKQTWVTTCSSSFKIKTSLTPWIIKTPLVSNWNAELAKMINQCIWLHRANMVQLSLRVLVYTLYYRWKYANTCSLPKSKWAKGSYYI
jgi:hypothetical protein